MTGFLAGTFLVLFAGLAGGVAAAVWANRTQHYGRAFAVWAGVTVLLILVAFATGVVR